MKIHENPSKSMFNPCGASHAYQHCRRKFLGMDLYGWNMDPSSFILRPLLLRGLWFSLYCLLSSSSAEGDTTVNALFIGNSYTARHDLAQSVGAFVEANESGLDFQPYTVIYAGSTLADHWRLGSANFVGINDLTIAEQKTPIASLEKAAAAPRDAYARSALKRHQKLLANLEESRATWDLVILQSYRDDLDGAKSRYHQFAPKFVKAARDHGAAKVILYETTPNTQNAEPLTTPPDPAPILEKAKSIAALADQLDVSVAPMSLVALRCQEQRPDLTLRFINDAHLNQVLSYLTACTLYAAIFEQSPEGIPVDSITDIRFFKKEDGTIDKTKDRNGDPITRKFSDKDRLQLQRIAWEAWTEFEGMRAK